MTTEFLYDDQRSRLLENSPLITKSNMPSFYPSTRQRTLITKHLTQNDDDDESDSIYKGDFIIQIFQHWKIKTIEHQHSLNNSENLSTSGHFTQALANKSALEQKPNDENISHEISSNQNQDEQQKQQQQSNINKNDQPKLTLAKREIPLSKSRTRRHTTIPKPSTPPIENSNCNLLPPLPKTKSASVRKLPKQAPIFIEPKRTQPSPIPHSHSYFSFDELTQTKRKTSLERSNTFSNEQKPLKVSSNWTPAPPTITPTRFTIQSSNNSVDNDDDDDDDDDNDGEMNHHKSLLIRNKKNLRETIEIKDVNSLTNPTNFIIPAAIIITDPTGLSRLYDWNNESIKEFNNDDTNLINRSITNDSSSLPSPTSDSYALHSIGEEEEELINKNNKDGIILSTELNRIEAFIRSRQTNKNENENQISNENNQIPLGRRWSDGAVSDDENHLKTTKDSLVRMPSVTSVAKQTNTPPVKLSKAKYLLMKLHLTSSNKSDEANLPPRTRTVRRSSDKKRYQTQ